MSMMVILNNNSKLRVSEQQKPSHLYSHDALLEFEHSLGTVNV